MTSPSRVRGAILAALCVLVALVTAPAHAGCAPPEPGDDRWPVASAESVGLDGDKLCALVAKFADWTEANIHGVVVVRHGKLVFEHYFRGYDLKARTSPRFVDFNATTGHDLRSVTKSVTALVLGVAIDRGLIPDVDQSVLSFFPDYADLRTPEKDRITIRHLLTMSMGLEWDDGMPGRNESTMFAARDPHRYVLSLPVVEPPGTRWNYSGGATALIGGILTRATGKRFDELATAFLFEPLGISDVEWTQMRSGHVVDWCCLWMRPRDMAKIGQLVLDRGRWQGKRVVSEAWVDAAIASQIQRPRDGAYGYQFWTGTASVGGRQVDWAAAVGQGGQRIFIAPALDLVAVVTAGHYYDDDRLARLVPFTVLNEYVLPAVDPTR
jgi:CubicO group peptidase (beta-lactamase class C family)